MIYLLLLYCQDAHDCEDREALRIIPWKFFNRQFLPPVIFFRHILPRQTARLYLTHCNNVTKKFDGLARYLHSYLLFIFYTAKNIWEINPDTYLFHSKLNKKGSNKWKNREEVYLSCV